jgi:hypothetical protein
MIRFVNSCWSGRILTKITKNLHECDLLFVGNHLTCPCEKALEPTITGKSNILESRDFNDSTVTEFEECII